MINIFVQLSLKDIVHKKETPITLVTKGSDQISYLSLFGNCLASTDSIENINLHRQESGQIIGSRKLTRNSPLAMKSLTGIN